MSDIDRLDIKAFVANTLTDLFATMLCLEVATLDEEPPNMGQGSQIVGSVNFAGDAMGNVAIYVTDGFARIIAAAMLDMDVDDIESDDEVHDVIGELCNMVGGDLKSRLCDYGYPCVLSIPTITVGNDFKVESKGWQKKERFGFMHREHTGLVEVHLKPGK